MACCSADGVVAVLTHNPDDTWTTKTFRDCNLGCNSVAWAPFSNGSPPRLCTGGCDSRIRLWALEEEEWKEDRSLGNGGHRDWVRDVAWCPVSEAGADCIASCGEDGQVLLWTSDGTTFNPSLVHQFPEPVWRVSFSVTGNVLAVSSGESDVSLWKREVGGRWSKVGEVEDGSGEGGERGGRR